MHHQTECTGTTCTMHYAKVLQLQTKPIAKKLGEGRVELLTGLMCPEHMQRLAPKDYVFLTLDYVRT